MRNTKPTRLVAALAVVAAVTLSSQAIAQNGALAPPISNWSYQRHASSVPQGVMQGQADIVRSVGQANYLNSVAAVNFQEAVKRSIENNGLYVRTYIEAREQNRQFRERYAASPPSPERWAQITAASLPERLRPDQYDSATGRLVWPHILRGEEYAAFRDRIDDILSTRRPEESGDGSPSQRRVAALVDGMAALLKSNIDTFSPGQYGAAKWFLRSVAYEAQQPMDSGPAPSPEPPVAGGADQEAPQDADIETIAN